VTADAASGPRFAVFCGAHVGHRAPYRRMAPTLAAAIASAGGTLVYGGAQVGLMGELADSCLAVGVPIVGIIPSFLVQAEVAHRGLDDLRIVASMGERKEAMMELADVVVTLPGGLGTLDELLEVLTLNQLGRRRLPCGLLDAEDFWAPLMSLLDRAHTDGFVATPPARLVTVDTNPQSLLSALLAQVSVS